MKYKHLDDIFPNHRTDFVMLYFAVYRSLRELKVSVHRINNGNLTHEHPSPFAAYCFRSCFFGVFILSSASRFLAISATSNALVGIRFHIMFFSFVTSWCR